MRKYVERSMSFSEYRSLIDGLAEQGDTTGTERTPSRVEFTRLNRQRMARLEKTITLGEEAANAATRNTRAMTWLIITESWCGDAAQNIPVIQKIAAASSNIETRYILRDENLELMDRFLENGSRSIPRLVALDRETMEVLGTWGSRPEALKSYFAELREQGLEKGGIGELLQRWYNSDKGRSLQSEYARLIINWGARKTAPAIA